MRNKRKSCKVKAPLEKQKRNKKLHGYLNKKAEYARKMSLLLIQVNWTLFQNTLSSFVNYCYPFQTLLQIMTPVLCSFAQLKNPKMCTCLLYPRPVARSNRRWILAWPLGASSFRSQTSKRSMMTQCGWYCVGSRNREERRKDR